MRLITQLMLVSWFAWMGQMADGTMTWLRIDTAFDDQHECEVLLRALAEARPDIVEGTYRVCLPAGIDANTVPTTFEAPTPGAPL
jgi:hypothetical protein